MDCTYSTFETTQSALHTCIRWWWGLPHQPVHQEQFGVKYLAQGHIDALTGLPISGRPALPLEPRLCYLVWCIFHHVTLNKDAIINAGVSLDFTCSRPRYFIQRESLSLLMTEMTIFYNQQIYNRKLYSKYNYVSDINLTHKTMLIPD